MPTHPDLTANAMIDASVDLLDTGTGTPEIVFLTAAEASVASCSMDGTNAFGAAGAVVARRADANAIADDTSAVAGTMDHVELRDRDGLARILATITTIAVGTGDFLVSSLVVPGGATVQVTSLTYTAPA